MAKKILCVIVFMLTLVCTFASCSGDKDETPSHTHNFGEWEITKSATCTAEGSKERYCSCGEKQSASISIAEHSYGNWETTKEATFTENGSESRQCACGKTETRDIPKKQSETTTLNATDCLNELNTVYLNSFNQKTIWFDEDGWIYARYFDGTESYAFFASEKDDVAKKMWYGIINGTYYYLEERITSTETQRKYEVINGLEVISAVENAGDGFQYLEYAISLVEEANTISCQKITDANGTKYVLKLIVDGNAENITITVVNGLITVYDHEDYTKATYSYDKTITMPSLNVFTPAN